MRTPILSCDHKPGYIQHDHRPGYIQHDHKPGYIQHGAALVEAHHLVLRHDDVESRLLLVGEENVGYPDLLDVLRVEVYGVLLGLVEEVGGRNVVDASLLPLEVQQDADGKVLKQRRTAGRDGGAGHGVAAQV